MANSPHVNAPIFEIPIRSHHIKPQVCEIWEEPEPEQPPVPLDPKINELFELVTNNGTVEQIRSLLESGQVDVNFKNPNMIDVPFSPKCATCLIIAAAVARPVEIIEVLIKAGADVSASADAGTNAVQLAAFQGSNETLKLLLDNGADVEVKDRHGWCPLISAALAGKTETCELLLDRGANLEARVAAGSTALIEAATSGKKETVELLLRRGAQVNAKNNQGKTALFFANQHQHPAIASLLREMGGTE